jgi:hypothetical protein
MWSGGYTVKVGGSLARPEALRPLVGALAELAKRYRLLVVPGGGPFADTVRRAQQAYGMSDEAAHWAAIHATDQYGLLLWSLAPGSRPVRELGEALKVAEAGRLPILLPSRLLEVEDPLEHSWRVTSDTIALYVAQRAGCRALILLKDVDGIYTTDPKEDPQATLLPRVGVKELASGDYRCVDEYFPRQLARAPIPCYVVNGHHPERLEALLAGRRGVWTTIEG